MQPNSEPTPADVSLVAAALGETPQAPAAPAPAQPTQPVAQPAPQMQPAAPTPQPSPTSQQTDPFESLFASEPAAPTAPAQPPQQPTEPTPTPQPNQPVEPSQPIQAPVQEPTQPTPPQGQAQAPAPAPLDPNADYETFEEYMNRVTADVPQAPAQPDPSKINPDDPEAIKSFFDDLVNTAVARAEAKVTKNSAIQQAETKAWDEAFGKYGSLRTNKPLRDMVHTIRMGYFNKGIAMTPTQAADKLLDAMKGQYQRGVADSTVVTTIEQVQPTGGGSGAPVPTTLDRESVLTQVQNGGETALANILDQEIKAGRL